MRSIDQKVKLQIDFLNNLEFILKLQQEMEKEIRARSSKPKGSKKTHDS